MNIFYLDENPVLAARYHCDKHVVKMVTETAQILSTVIRMAGIDDDDLYRETHKHHPCVKWCAQSKHHYEYALRLLDALSQEYFDRYGRIHKASLKYDTLALWSIVVPDRGWLMPPKCMPEQYHLDSVVESYRAYYRGDKARFAKWKIEVPDWWRA